MDCAKLGGQQTEIPYHHPLAGSVLFHRAVGMSSEGNISVCNKKRNATNYAPVVVSCGGTAAAYCMLRIGTNLRLA